VCLLWFLQAKRAGLHGVFLSHAPRSGARGARERDEWSAGRRADASDRPSAGRAARRGSERAGSEATGSKEATARAARFADAACGARERARLTRGRCTMRAGAFSGAQRAPVAAPPSIGFVSMAFYGSSLRAAQRQVARGVLRTQVTPGGSALCELECADELANCFCLFLAWPFAAAPFLCAYMGELFNDWFWWIAP
jgi:hypothetical protein